MSTKELIKITKDWCKEEKKPSLLISMSPCLLQGVRLHNGLYSIYLKDWLQVFPREQVLVVRMEDYQKNISKTLEDIYHHLGLSESLLHAKQYQ